MPYGPYTDIGSEFDNVTAHVAYGQAAQRGLMSAARQIREMADWLKPVAAAIDRVGQRVPTLPLLFQRLADH
jgi:hypothetical protein